MKKCGSSGDQLFRYYPYSIIESVASVILWAHVLMSLMLIRFTKHNSDEYHPLLSSIQSRPGISTPVLLLGMHVVPC